MKKIIKKIKKLFGGIDLTWKRLIIFSIVIAIYVGLINQVGFLSDTSFRDIAISYECWIFFAIVIIMNSRSNIDAALKTFVFFLISQPLIYLVESPFLGIQVLGYYKNWIVPTLLTLPMGYIGYYMKKDKWYGLLILMPMLIFLTFIHGSAFFAKTIFSFPRHLISFLICVITPYMFIFGIFSKKRERLIGSIVTSILIIGLIVYKLVYPLKYEAVLLYSDENYNFDESYNIMITNDNVGDFEIISNEQFNCFELIARFKHSGKTKITLSNKEKSYSFDINVINASEYEMEESK